MARQAGFALKAYPRLSFLITIKGVDAMNYRIETKELFEDLKYLAWNEFFAARGDNVSNCQSSRFAGFAR